MVCPHCGARFGGRVTDEEEIDEYIEMDYYIDIFVNQGGGDQNERDAS